MATPDTPGPSHTHIPRGGFPTIADDGLHIAPDAPTPDTPSHHTTLVDESLLLVDDGYP